MRERLPAVIVLITAIALLGGGIAVLWKPGAGMIVAALLLFIVGASLYVDAGEARSSR